MIKKTKSKVKYIPTRNLTKIQDNISAFIKSLTNSPFLPEDRTIIAKVEVRKPCSPSGCDVLSLQVMASGNCHQIPKLLSVWRRVEVANLGVEFDTCREIQEKAQDKQVLQLSFVYLNDDLATLRFMFFLTFAVHFFIHQCYHYLYQLFYLFICVCRTESHESSVTSPDACSLYLITLFNLFTSFDLFIRLNLIALTFYPFLTSQSLQDSDCLKD